MAPRSAALPRCLRHLAPAAEVATGIDIILIPGVGSPPVTGWGILSPSFNKQISNLKPRPKILAFEYSATADKSFSWRALLAAGEDLLSTLVAMQAKNANRPLVFVCHSLGGIILKQCLALANQKYATHLTLFDVIVGIMFLGTPHLLSPKEAFSERIFKLIRACLQGSLSKPQESELIDDFWMLNDVGRRFQDIAIRTEILSLYEKKPTKVGGGGLLLRSSKQILVDKKLSAIGATYEQPLGLDLDHLSLCEMLDGDIGDSPLFGWLRSVIVHSTKNIEQRTMHRQGRSSPTLSFASFTAMEKSLGQAGRMPPSHRYSTDDTLHASNGSTTFDAVMIPLLDNMMAQRKQAILPCVMIEAFERNGAFVGREDVLRSLDHTLLPKEERLVSSELQQQRYATICGLGGLGKTQIAIEFAFSRQNKFDAVFWLRADTREKLDADLAKVAVSLGLAESSGAAESQVIARETAKGWLSNPKRLLDGDNDSVGTSEANWLLIFDNADDADILPDYTNFFASGSVLVTSRHPLAGRVTSENFLAIDLQPFDEREGTNLLHKITGRSKDLETEKALQITRKLGGLPLAISQMAGIIRGQMLSYSDFLDLYNDEAERLELYGLEVATRQTTARGTLATVWAIEMLSARAKSVLHLLAFLDPDCIPDFVLDKLVKSQSGSFMMPEECPKSKLEYTQARAVLLERSLIQRNQERGEIWIHRILQDIVRAKLTDVQRSMVFSSTIELVHHAWPKAKLDQRHNTERWDTCQKIYPHIQFLLSLYDGGNLSIDEEVEVKFAGLLNEAGWFQIEKGNSHSSHKNKELLRRAFQICERHPKHPAVNDLVCDIHYSLGAVANETNDAKSCVRHNTEFLRIREKIAKEAQKPDLRLAIAHNQMGTGWMMLEDFNKAATAFQNAIDTYEKLPDFQLYMLSMSLANLGLAYWLMGEYRKASEALERGIADRVTLFGEDDRESFRTGRLLHAMGNVRASQGCIDESESFHQRALFTYQPTIGNNHHRTADVCHKVAQHCLRRQDYTKALLLVDQALKIWEVDKDAYLPEISRTSFLKAKIRFVAGDEKGALVLFKQAASGLKKLAPEQMKSLGDLRESDFDALVTFWSK